MPITHQKFTGRTLYLMVETSAGVYAQVGGLRADSLSIGNEEIDITDKSDDNWKKLLAGGGRSLSVSGSGFITNSSAFEKLQDAANTGTPINAKLVYKAGKAYAAPFLVTSCEMNGEYNGAQQFSASLVSMNTPYIGIAGAVPTLDLNFAETGSIQPNIGTATMTHTRASAALYRDVDGYLKSAATNVPRFEHDSAGNRMGYLPEPQSTNLLLRSQEFDNASWVKADATVSADAAVAPDGTATADKVAENTANAEHNASQGISKAASAIQYTGSIFMKAAERTWAILTLYSVATGVGNRQWVNLGTGQLGTAVSVGGGFTSVTAAIEPYRDGWYRVSITATSNTATDFYLYAATSTGDTVLSFTGTSGSGIYLWGAQLEVQPQTTSYIATTSAQVTRSADSLKASGISGLSATEATVYTEAYVPAVAAAASAYFAALTDAATDNFVAALKQAASVNNRTVFVAATTTVADFTAATPAIGTISRVALAAKVNGFAASFDGAAVQTDSAGAFPTTPNELHVGLIGTTQQPGRPVKRISYYNTRVANSDLVALAGG